MKQTVKLNESQLKGIVAESVRKVLTEMDWKAYYNAHSKAENVAENIDDVVAKCRGLIEAIEEVFYDRHGYPAEKDNATPLSPMLRQKLDVDGLLKKLENFSKSMEVIRDRKANQSDKFHERGSDLEDAAFAEFGGKIYPDYGNYMPINRNGD